MKKLIIASDIHGSLAAANKIVDVFEKSGADRLILLGDILYHGPRNPLPEGYDPMAVAALLNGMKDKILCVRGNCDADVDQMVLNFPITAQVMLLYVKGRRVFAAHGDLYNIENPPPLSEGDILLHGHTHLPEVTSFDGKYYLNPGSAALPKGGNPPTYMEYDAGSFIIYNFDGTKIKELVLA